MFFISESEFLTLFNEDKIPVGEGKRKTTYKFVPPGQGHSGGKKAHVDYRIKFGLGSENTMMTVAINDKTKTVNMDFSKMSYGANQTVEDFKNVVFYTAALLAYDYDRFDSIRSQPDQIKAAKDMMNDFNNLSKSERDEYYRQGKENINNANKNYKWPK